MKVVSFADFVYCRKLLTWWRSRDNKKEEKVDNVYMRWEQDKDLQPLSPLGLFDEYLEMGEEHFFFFNQFTQF